MSSQSRLSWNMFRKLLANMPSRLGENPSGSFERCNDINVGRHDTYVINAEEMETALSCCPSLHFSLRAKEFASASGSWSLLCKRPPGCVAHGGPCFLLCLASWKEAAEQSFGARSSVSTGTPGDSLPSLLCHLLSCGSVCAEWPT